MKKRFFSFLILATAAASSWAHAAPYVPDANAPRASVPAIYKWNTAPLFASDGAWEAAARAVKGDLAAIGRCRGNLTDAAGVSACLASYFAASQKLGRIALYSSLKLAEDENVERYNTMRQRALALVNDFQSRTSFVRQELLALSDAAAQAILADDRVRPYRGYLADLRRRKGATLGAEAERVLAPAGDNLWAEIDLNELPSDVEMVFKATQRDIALPVIADESGQEVQLTFANYGKYRASKDRGVRERTVESFFAALAKYQDVFAAALAAEMKRDVFMARARGYARAVDAYLDRQNVPTAAMDTLISAVHANLGPLHRYVTLRKKLMGLTELRIYDLYPPIVPVAQSEISYDDAVAQILEAFKPLGESYVASLGANVKPGGGWVDVYPNKGKESGAFSSSVYGVHPFVKLNFMDDVDDALTAAHEFGHAMHSEINAKANPFVESGYSIFTAEIASTFNEMLYSKYLLAKFKDDDRMRLYLLGRLVETIRQTIYRQTLFAEFERKVHAFIEAGTPVTAELLNRTYADLVRLYYGPGFTLGKNDGVEWAYIPHFYWKYYVFTYATGLASGIALSEKVADGDAAAREAYLAMLAEPRSAAPIEILKKAGLDLTRPDAVSAAARFMDRAIAEMERISARMR